MTKHFMQYASGELQSKYLAGAEIQGTIGHVNLVRGDDLTVITRDGDLYQGTLSSIDIGENKIIVSDKELKVDSLIFIGMSHE